MILANSQPIDINNWNSWIVYIKNIKKIFFIALILFYSFQYEYSWWGREFNTIKVQFFFPVVLLATCGIWIIYIFSFRLLLSQPHYYGFIAIDWVSSFLSLFLWFFDFYSKFTFTSFFFIYLIACCSICTYDSQYHLLWGVDILKSCSHHAPFQKIHLKLLK